MFRALPVHLQATLHKRHLVFCVRVISVDCTRIGVELEWNSSPVAVVWRDFRSGLPFQTRLIQTKPVLSLPNEHG
jgi:hypothetical protein